MQQVKPRFLNPDGSRCGSLQSCIRINDLQHIGDGSHLTYFQMIGNFSFGGHDYEMSVELWDSIVRDLKIPISEVRVHPSRLDHKLMWTKRGYHVVDDRNCTWDGDGISGECCELFVGTLEIGNLVNPLGHSTDVGFGWERLHQVVEQKSRVDETSLFDQKLHPIVRDHYRTLVILKKNGIKPGSKGKEFVCLRLVRRILGHISDNLPGIEDWIEMERELQNKKLPRARQKFGKFRDKSPEWWYETFGVFPEELD